MVQIQEKENAVLFTIRVVPRASHSEWAGFQDGAVKIRITAPPVDGKANEECLRMVADFLGVKKRQVTIVSGHTSRTKTVSVEGLDVKEVAARLAELQPGRVKRSLFA
jgi:uncharacterized protein (TIGR00251 family)